ncbi:MAG: hypothetical protein WBB28_12475 [Crinalium sp.]
MFECLIQYCFLIQNSKSCRRSRFTPTPTVYTQTSQANIPGAIALLKLHSE